MVDQQVLYNDYNFFNQNSFFQYKPIDQFPDNSCEKHNDRNGIYYMHHLKIETGGPVWVFLPEKIHGQI
jgi:hypothetical protein